METPLVFGKLIPGVPSVLAVGVQPGAKLAPLVLAAAFFPTSHSFPRQTRGLVHHSAAIPRQTTGHPRRSPCNARGITHVEGLISLGQHRLHRPLLSADLSGRGDPLGSSLLATEPVNNDVMHVSGDGSNGTPLIEVPRGGKSIEERSREGSHRQGRFLLGNLYELILSTSRLLKNVVCHLIGIGRFLYL
jgi:hypothetical protein